jgi:hypothetical protein
MFEDSLDLGTGGGSAGSSSAGNWWEGPPPAGYNGPWPPPLPPGASYGPIFGQIVYGQGTGWNDVPGWTDPGAPGIDAAGGPTYGAGAAPAPTPTPGPGGGGAGGGTPSTSGGSLVQPFGQGYTPSTAQPLPTIGGSVVSIPGAPQFPNIPRFVSPSIEEAMADPGYKFILDQGNQNLQNWAAARGTLNDSSTAKAMIDYGQNAATTQYGNVWDRDMNAYRTNVETQYLDPFQAQYQNWITGTVGPTMTNYGTNAQNVQHLNDVSWQDNWNSWLQNWNIFRDQRDSTFNKQFAVATA